MHYDSTLTGTLARQQTLQYKNRLYTPCPYYFKPGLCHTSPVAMETDQCVGLKVCLSVRKRFSLSISTIFQTSCTPPYSFNSSSHNSSLLIPILLFVLFLFQMCCFFSMKTFFKSSKYRWQNDKQNVFQFNNLRQSCFPLILVFILLLCIILYNLSFQK